MRLLRSLAVRLICWKRISGSSGRFRLSSNLIRVQILSSEGGTALSKAHKVITDAIALKVKQEFAAKERVHAGLKKRGSTEKPTKKRHKNANRLSTRGSRFALFSALEAVRLDRPVELP